MLKADHCALCDFIRKWGSPLYGSVIVRTGSRDKEERYSQLFIEAHELLSRTLASII